MTTLDAFEKTELTKVALRLAEAARQVILPYFRTTDLVVENKLSQGQFDPVTAADRAAEKAMLDILGRDRPDDAVLGEEFGAKPGSSGLTWVLDPIDGTRAFMSGTPTWGVLVAVGPDTGPELGIIDQPYIGERFFGGFGQAWMAGPAGKSDLATRQTTRLEQAVLFSTFPEIGTSGERVAFEALSAQVQLTRFGMDCYAYALLAAGQIDLVVEAGLNAYDIQAPIALIQAAGGVVTNWQGDPAHKGGQVVAAANPALLEQALRVLNP